MRVKLTVYAFVLFFCAALVPTILHAADAQFTAINPNIPGSDSPQDPVDLIVAVYRFALMGAGLLAFGAILWGSIRYTTAGGNTSTQGDARDQITQALLGLGLLLAGYLILRTINPAIVAPSLFDIGGSLSGDVIGARGGRLPAVGERRGTGIEEVDRGTRFQGRGCGTHCSRLDAAGLACKHSGSCAADRSVIQGLNCISQSTGLQFTVTEAYPPTADHDDKDHYNGCAVDVRIEGAVTCEKVRQFVDAASSCNLAATGEYYTICAGTPYGRRFGKTSGEHVHVEGCFALSR